MKRKSIIRNSIALALVTFGASSLVGCKKKGAETDQVFFSFSIGIKSGAHVIQFGEGASTEYVQYYDNGIDTSGRSYSFSSTDDSVASIDQDGKITPHKEGKVNFIVTENKSGDKQTLSRDIQVVPYTGAANGGYNYAGGTSEAELSKRAEILGKLEKYAMDSHLTGITLFDNGGYVRYSDRIELGTETYITGYGFGLLTEGRIKEGQELPGGEGRIHPTFLHSSIAQDSLKINQYTATGSQVSDLASYITSSYWNTKLTSDTTYGWYPCLAASELTKVPKVSKVAISEDYPKGVKVEYVDPENDEQRYNERPFAMEPENSTGLYRKWRVYVKTSEIDSNFVYRTASSTLSSFDDRGVALDDYLYIYKLLFTGSNQIIRGTEMANDTSYGIKGAQRYFNDTKSKKNSADINTEWNAATDKTLTGKDNYQWDSKLGLQIGHDAAGQAFIDIELINPIDKFTAMYTLSSSLTSPLPKDLFEGPKAIAGNMHDAINKYGTFDNGGNGAIINKTLCLGAFYLTEWDKNSKIVFTRNDKWFEVGDRYHIPGVYIRRIDVESNTEKNWLELENGNLDSAGVPSKKVEAWIGKKGVYQTKGDATFKLNVNSCNEEQWNDKFGPQGKISANSSWTLKPWMSNSDFLDGLFYSIDRAAFAKKRGVTPSINYFSDSYLSDPVNGISYNDTQAHKNAVAGYETINKKGESDYGYNYDKAVNCFRNAVKQLSSAGKMALGSSKSNPATIQIHIRWMYQTDIKEYGEDIKSYFETAFNDDAVSGGRVKLEVVQEAVTVWEDVYDKWMMKGQFDLGFGAISGNTYNPLNFMEVLKSDNSSNFTLNWGPDTSKVDEKNPILYDGKKWSYDALWEAADHGGIVRTGEIEKPVKKCTNEVPTKIDSAVTETNLYKGFKVEIPVEFAEFTPEDGYVKFGIDRVDLYVFGARNVTLAEFGSENLVYDEVNKKVIVTVPESKASEINTLIKETNGYTDTDTETWHKNPFLYGQIDSLYSFELYYTIQIGEEGVTTINYSPVKHADI